MELPFKNPADDLLYSVEEGLNYNKLFIEASKRWLRLRAEVAVAHLTQIWKGLKIDTVPPLKPFIRNILSGGFTKSHILLSKDEMRLWQAFKYHNYKDSYDRDAHTAIEVEIIKLLDEMDETS